MAVFGSNGPAAGERRRLTTTSPISRRALLGAAGMSALGLSGCGLGNSASNGRSSSGKATKPAESASTPPKPDGDITLFTYANYVDPWVIKRFEKAHDVKVTYTFLDSEDEILTKVGAGQPYDVAILTSTLIPLAIQGNILSPVNHNAMKNWSQVSEPFFKDPFYDTDSGHCVPYAVGGAGIVWRKDKLKGAEPTGDWGDLWDHPEASEHIFMWDQAADAIGVGLVAAGHEADSIDPGDIRDAVDKLLALKPMLGGYTGDEGTLLNNGRAWLSFGWAGDVFVALGRAQDPPASAFDYVPASKGSFYNSDNFVIPVTAKSPGTAALFLDHCLAPDNVAANVKYSGYPIPTDVGLHAYQDVTAKYSFLSDGLGSMTDQKQWAVPVDAERQKVYKDAFLRVKA